MPLLPTPQNAQRLSTLLTGLQDVLPTNTALQQAGGSVLVNTDDLILLGQASWPCLVILEMGEKVERDEWFTWKQNPVQVQVLYLDLWQPQTSTINTMWGNIGLDLRRMAFNLLSNPTLVINGTPSADRLVSLDVSSRKDLAIDDKTYGFSVIQRWIDLQFELAPFTTQG